MEQVVCVALTAVVVLGLVIYFTLINPKMLRGALQDSAPPPSVADSGPAPVVVIKGAVTSSSDRHIALPGVAGKPFRVTGEVWLDGNPPASGSSENAPAGFSLYLRETDDTHRYELNSNFVRDKRRMINGAIPAQILYLLKFPTPTLHRWIPFSATATANQIVYYFGDNACTIPGPVDLDGANEILLANGSKLQNLEVQELPGGK